MYNYYMVIRITRWICTDATIKLRQATRVQEKYKSMISYELGNIAAGIHEKFQHMLDTYRKYSNIKQHRDNYHYIETIFNAYFIIKGDFNEIQMERDQYYEVLKRHETKLQATKKQKNKILDILADLKARARRSQKEDGGPQFKPQKNDLRKDFKKEEEYKRSLRYKKWAEKWNNFIPEVEGVDIVEEAKPNI
ncbi:uncharacterized protein LOC114359304 [Ostrinia furnacalis]|nr:uncharacterized protein LOC114359304 [Ostrinia furnacalis]